MPCQRSFNGLPTGGVHSVPTERMAAVAAVRWGRPVPERGTPVNMENRLHRDNGEGVAATPLPYPPVRVTRRVMTPRSVNFAALLIRLNNTCRSLV